MKRFISAFIAVMMLSFCLVSSVTVNAKSLESQGVFFTEDFEAPENETVTYPRSILSSDEITAGGGSGNITGYKGWSINVEAPADEIPGMYTVDYKSEEGGLVGNESAYLDLTREKSGSTSNCGSTLYKKLDTAPSKNNIVKLSYKLCPGGGSYSGYLFTMGFKFFTDDLTNIYWKPFGKSAYHFTEEEKAIFEAWVWNKVEFVLDYNNSTLSLIVNDTQIGPAQEMKTMPEVTEIRLWTSRTDWASQNKLYIDDIKLEQFSYVESYSVTDISYMSADGFFVSSPSGGDVIETVTVEKSAASDGECKLLVACFDNENKLSAIKAVDVTDSDFENDSATIDVNLQISEDAYLDGGKTKVFFWEKSDLVKPLEEPAVFEITEKAPTLYLMGDSTMADYVKKNFPKAGTGMMLPEYFDGIEVVNKAASGAGTDTYLGLNAEGVDHRYDWSLVRDKVKEGDYVLIQLGINDFADDIGIENYKENLNTIIGALHSKKANVILSTVNIMYKFDEEGKFLASFDEEGNFTGTSMYTSENGDYVETLYNYIEENADMTGFASIDMVASTAELIGKDAVRGDESCYYFVCDTYFNNAVYHEDLRITGSDYFEGTQFDNVHLTIYGADVFAQMMAKKIAELDIPLSKYVSEKINSQIEYPDLGNFKYSDETD